MWKLWGELMNSSTKFESPTWWSGLYRRKDLCLRVYRKAIELRAPNRKDVIQQKREQILSYSSTFSLWSKKALALLHQRIKEDVICLPEVEFLPTIRDEKVQSIVLLIRWKDFHRSNVSPSESFLMRNKKAKEIFFQEGAINANNMPFPTHNDREKAHRMPLTVKRRLKETRRKYLRPSQIVWMTQQVENLFKIKLW